MHAFDRGAFDPVAFDCDPEPNGGAVQFFYRRMPVEEAKPSTDIAALLAWYVLEEM